ncbi:MAG: hypothetical protein J0L75_10450 [Spirochaetes bacterium]|nr:hypothetical protein [Spirochaetota bacterium]
MISELPATQAHFNRRVQAMRRAGAWAKECASGKDLVSLCQEAWLAGDLDAVELSSLFTLVLGGKLGWSVATLREDAPRRIDGELHREWRGWPGLRGAALVLRADGTALPVDPAHDESVRFLRVEAGDLVSLWATAEEGIDGAAALAVLRSAWTGMPLPEDAQWIAFRSRHWKAGDASVVEGKAPGPVFDPAELMRVEIGSAQVGALEWRAAEALLRAYLKTLGGEGSFFFEGLPVSSLRRLAQSYRPSRGSVLYVAVRRGPDEARRRLAAFLSECLDSPGTAASLLEAAETGRLFEP